MQVALTMEATAGCADLPAELDDGGPILHLPLGLLCAREMLRQEAMVHRRGP